MPSLAAPALLPNATLHELYDWKQYHLQMDWRFSLFCPDSNARLKETVKSTCQAAALGVSQALTTE